MEKVSLTCQLKMVKKHTNKLLKWDKTMIIRQVISWIISTFQNIAS